MSCCAAWGTEVGSSPRVRGKHPVLCRRDRPVRLIPACAGKTTACRAPPRPATAHPRVCGENSSREGRAHPLGGSSPRVRGKLGGPLYSAESCRLIPACAGKTLVGGEDADAAGAHPRVCGENQDLGVLDLTETGSSPRVRGKQRHPQARPDEAGLIPACAGKTSLARSAPQMRRAHPRVCGENLRDGGGDEVPPGSSPRVRGKLGAVRSRLDRLGLIPACAGKTPGSAGGGSRGSAHPRVCGENAAFETFHPAVGGSSPRVRGKPGIE